MTKRKISRYNRENVCMWWNLPKLIKQTHKQTKTQQNQHKLLKFMIGIV